MLRLRNWCSIGHEFTRTLFRVLEQELAARSLLPASSINVGGQQFGFGTGTAPRKNVVDVPQIG
jgi:hypothetical protein